MDGIIIGRSYHILNETLQKIFCFEQKIYEILIHVKNVFFCSERVIFFKVIT